MLIKNCISDIFAYLCDIPQNWREGITKALCFVNQDNNIVCNDIQKCETLTNLSAFTLNNTELSVTFKNERGELQKRSVDIRSAIETVLNSIDPKCLMTQNEWNLLSYEGKIQSIINGHCECCITPTTTTTSTTTTTTIFDTCCLITDIL
jgi:hypothetical protein